MNLSVLQTNCGKFKMSCQHNTEWQCVMSIYVRGLGMVKPVHAQHLLFQDRLQNSLKRVLKESSRFFQVALLQSFSADRPTPQATTLLTSERSTFLVFLSVRKCCRDFICRVLLSHKHQGTLDWTLGKDLYIPWCVFSSNIKKVKTDSSQKKISMACEI